MRKIMIKKSLRAYNTIPEQVITRLFCNSPLPLIIGYTDYVFYFPALLMTACAAASLAIGTRNGEQDT